ncbi:hypothetical protein CTAYLR_002940 [Chrysophaeum taylorii]|uniref:Uncharacterized protein n=1 Tax=Chrysophaeum taylorii TaxID=2483200 RepID=A0AAD7UMR8_9STRA|nr:hypothetical protein CTAYLR_002940 [Chrysophaeum taylorii]
MKIILALVLATAAAFVPHHVTPFPKTVVFGSGKYDGQLWDLDAKMDIWGAWDPNTPRSETNFNPFERNPDGNACDASGYFPGETNYKDPMRPEMNWAGMMKEKETMAFVEANPKAGDVPGAPGRLK